MEMMNKFKKVGSALNQKVTALAVAGSSFVATNAVAGPLAEAVTTEMESFKTDLYSVGAVVIGLAVVGVGVGMVIHMMYRAR